MSTLGVQRGMQGLWKTRGRPHRNQETLEASNLHIVSPFPDPAVWKRDTF